MRLFQNSSAGRGYGRFLERALSREPTFAAKIAAFHREGYDASHTLAPVIAQEESAFYTHGDNRSLQRTWAIEHGMPANSSLLDILLAQIEAHRTEVFYNLDFAASFGSDLIRRLPGSVKARIGWHAAPPTGADMTGYLMVCNFPSILESFRAKGLRTAYFAPAHDTKLDAYSANEDRDIDVLFVGGYSQHHSARAAILKQVSRLSPRLRIKFALSRSRLTKLAESPLGVIGPLRRYRRPESVRAIASAPVFGSDYYALLGRTRIVINGAINMSGRDRGNMRCWEALGARTLLLSDEGNYPAGMVDGETMAAYRDAKDAVGRIEEYLADESLRHRIANNGYEMVRSRYSKASQWTDFCRIVAEQF